MPNLGLTSLPRDPDLIEVGIGQVAVAEPPRRLVAPALGSCVGLVLYDRFGQRGGLAHIMLPTYAGEGVHDRSGRFADLAVPDLVSALAEAGSPRRRLEAKIAGGAAMFHADGPIANIGNRNVAEVKRQLTLMSIPLVAEDIGEAYARTVELVLETGEVLVRSYQYGVRRL